MLTATNTEIQIHINTQDKTTRGTNTTHLRVLGNLAKLIPNLLKHNSNSSEEHRTCISHAARHGVYFCWTAKHCLDHQSPHAKSRERRIECPSVRCADMALACFAECPLNAWRSAQAPPPTQAPPPAYPNPCGLASRAQPCGLANRANHITARPRATSER